MVLSGPQVVFPVFQNFGKELHAHGDGHDGAQDIGDGLGVEDAGGAEEFSQQENGGEIHGLSPEAQGQGHLDLAHARQTVDDGVLDAQGDDGDGDDLDGPEGLGGDGGILGEEGNEQGAAEVGQNEQQGIVSGAQQADEPVVIPEIDPNTAPRVMYEGKDVCF